MGINNKKSFTVIRKIVCMIPPLFVLAMLILHPALPDKTFSTEERRYLTQWPVFQLEKVVNGSYQTQVEAYFSDQFPFRNFWIDIRDGSNQILLK